MQLVVGLGNPEYKYQNTRHNVGFMTIDALTKQLFDVQWLIDKKFNSLIIEHQPSAIYLKPQTYMNASGEAISAITNFYKINTEDIWVIHDDLDLALGEYKVQKGRGPKLHYGIKSIEEKLGNSEFWRVRIGVDNRDSENRIPGEAYVLQDFVADERKIIDIVIEKVISELLEILNPKH